MGLSKARAKLEHGRSNAKAGLEFTPALLLTCSGLAPALSGHLLQPCLMFCSAPFLFYPCPLSALLRPWSGPVQTLLRTFWGSRLEQGRCRPEQGRSRVGAGLDLGRNSARPELGERRVGGRPVFSQSKDICICLYSLVIKRVQCVCHAYYIYIYIYT
jgi:hypothetical protein